jgi:outer membrane lipopolysaccharide assembly protein LptE/RlpB
MLIQSCVEAKDTQEAVSFLEDLLSPATKLPRSIKHAARAAYQKIARTTTVDIIEQEENLGLPFQVEAARAAPA